MNSRRRGRASESELRHPMLLDGAGIATIAAACTTAANSLTLSAVMLVLCCGMATVYIFERGEYMPPMLGVIYLVSASFIVCICGKILILIAEATAESIGMYLPLAAADALVLARLQPDSPFVSPSDALPHALEHWWLYALMAVPIGILREILGCGTLLGAKFFIRLNAGGMTLPFAGFIMLGFGLAIYNRFSEK